MTHKYIELKGRNDVLIRAFEDVRKEFKVAIEFEPDVLAEAQAVSPTPSGARTDLTSLPFVTIDPASAQDLDQALHIESLSSGFRVRYAIADVAACVSPGGAIDRATHQRGVTMYCPDTKAPLHPLSISENIASLLPNEIRRAYVWTMDLDADGAVTDTRVEKALVKSRAKLDYVSLQKQIDSHSADPMIALLERVGTLRIEQEIARGGVDLPLPTQEVFVTEQTCELTYRAPNNVERWNAQISLMTGMAAADMMISAKVGILRTMPPADDHDVAILRKLAQHLGIEWEQTRTYAELLRTLDPSCDSHATFIANCTLLMRGAGYQAFNGELPQLLTHSGVAAAYAHVTAPLRRLVDRYALEVCLSLSSGVEVPSWVISALDQIPDIMSGAHHVANSVERGCTDAAEAFVLQDQVGKVFNALVTESGRGKSTIVIAQPAIQASCLGEFPVGEQIAVTLKAVDISTRSVTFEAQ